MNMLVNYRLLGFIVFNSWTLLKSLSLVIRLRLCIIAVAAIIASGVFIFLVRLIFTHWATTLEERDNILASSINALTIASFLLSGIT